MSTIAQKLLLFCQNAQPTKIHDDQMATTDRRMQNQRNKERLTHEQINV